MSSALGEATGPLPSRLGRYELITQIGQGGMAEVQLALQRGPAGFEKLVVVKLVHANLASQKPFVDMLLDEARIAALVKHPNVVDIYDLGVVEGRYFIAMEYLEGEPLLAVLRAGRDGKRLDPLSTARLIADTAEGLDAAHELRSMAGDPIELVHHDVSLGNIVVLYNGQAKLVDFGVAKATMSSAVPARVQGKFSYMAPEKLSGGAGDRRSDIWSLGCVLWEALTLRRLFKGGNDSDTMHLVLESQVPKPSSVNGDVLADFDPIVMRALERDAAKRYPTAKELATELEDVLRKQGYGGRNDQIAKYMQATFESHITARKKLLQEVSSKGRASAAVLEAAFRESPDRPLRTTGEFSAKFTNPSFPEGTPHEGATATKAAPAYPRATAEQLEAFQNATVIDAPLVVDDDPATAAIAPPAESPRTVTPARNRRTLVALGAVAAALVIVIVTSVILIVSREDPPSLAIAPAAASGPDAEPVARAEPADAAGVLADADMIVMEALDAAKAKPPAPPPPTPPPPVERKLSVAELNSKAFKEFAAGNNREALAMLGKAKALAPGHAATHRLLGMVYERLGQRVAARSAFQRYLTLAPKAGDAESIRTRMEKL